MPRGYSLFLPESNPLCREGYEGGGEDERIFLLFWYATAPLMKRILFLLSLLSVEKLCFWDKRWFWDGIFSFFFTCE